MPYVFQNFVTGSVLTETQLDQIESNIRGHIRCYNVILGSRNIRNVCKSLGIIDKW